MHRPVFALAIVARAVGALHDASGPAGVLSVPMPVAGGDRLGTAVGYRGQIQYQHQAGEEENGGK